MKLFTALGLSVALLAVPTLASADAKVEGTWVIDVKATMATVTAAQTLPPDQLQAMTQEMTQMSQTTSITFIGNRLEADMGSDVTKCDWSWGNGGEILPKNCLDGSGKPNDLDPERESIEWKGGALYLHSKPDNVSMVFKRK